MTVYLWNYDPNYTEKLGLLQTIDLTITAEGLNIYDIKAGIMYDNICNGIIKITNKDTGEIYTYHVVNEKIVSEEEYRRHELILKLSGVKGD